MDPQDAARQSDHFDPAATGAALIGTRFANRLEHFPLVNSTSTMLLEAAAAGAAEGTAYLADEQSAGRGRGGHGWHSAPADGLYLSALVRPALYLRDALLLSLATGLAARQAIHALTALELDLRWPNDLMLHGKKLGGILVETAVEPGPDPLLRYAVIGIGINLRHTEFPPELAGVATSLALESDQRISRGALVTAFLRALDLELTRLESSDGHASLLARFAAESTWVRGKRVHVPEQGGYAGVTAGLDERGYLLVRADDGTKRTVLSGGVREAGSTAPSSL